MEMIYFEDHGPSATLATPMAIMSIFSYLFPGVILGVINSSVNTKFVQLHYFLSQNIGEAKDILSPFSKSWRDMALPSPLKLRPCPFAFSVMSVVP